MLDSADQRVRQEAQFALVGKGIESLPTLIELIEQEEFAFLHCMAFGHWVNFSGQVSRKHPILFFPLQSEQSRSVQMPPVLQVASESWKPEIFDFVPWDESNRVVSLAAIALGRICKPGDREAERAV